MAKLTWQEYFPEYINMSEIKNHESYDFLEDYDFTDINKALNKSYDKNILPYPELVYNAFYKTKFDDIKVVILGQEPYFNIKNNIPEAMGLSFSVLENIKIPSSLKNIYKNLIDFKHLDKMPNSGNLEKWANQGCLLLNTALTVEESKKNSHSKVWQNYTDLVIKNLSDKKENLIFVLWGQNALNKLDLIDSKNHKIIISSHPSGLSYNKKLGEYNSFKETNHFGKINKYLIKYNKEPIDFTI
jgi:uracil-DNA glycosylase